jgi:GDP-L-fucose synthase
MASKILILGSTGLVGGFLAAQLSQEYNVVCPTRAELDLLDTHSVLDYFNKNPVDVVINCAANTNSAMTPFDSDAIKTNIGIFTNLYAVRDFYNRLLNFGSGAEFDRSRNITNVREEELFLSLPHDHYGMSKNAIARIVFDTDNCYNLRLFGVFGPQEPDHRLLKKIAAGHTVTLIDKFFDYIYINDILPVVKYYIDQDCPKFKDINLVYPTKTRLSYFVQQFCSYHKLPGNNVVISTEPGLNYTGSAVRIETLDLPMQGLEKGIQEYL